MATSPHSVRSGGYESSDASPRGLLYFGISMAAVLAVVSLLLIVLFKHYESAEKPGLAVARPFATAQPVPPAPRIQANPSADMETYAQSQQNILNTYGWVDRQNGIIRMPIERAMELLLQRGLPARSANSVSNAARAPQQDSADRTPRPGGPTQ